MVEPRKKAGYQDLDHPELEEEYQERSEDKHEEMQDRVTDEETNSDFEYSPELYNEKYKPKISNEHQTNFTFWIKQMDEIASCWKELGTQMMDVYIKPGSVLAMNSTLQKLWMNMKHGFEDPYNPVENKYHKAIEFQIESINARCASMAELLLKEQNPNREEYLRLIKDMRFTQSELYRGLSALGVLMRFNKRPAYKKLLDEYEDEPSEAIEGNE